MNKNKDHLAFYNRLSLRFFMALVAPVVAGLFAMKFALDEKEALTRSHDELTLLRSSLLQPIQTMNHALMDWELDAARHRADSTSRERIEASFKQLHLTSTQAKQLNPSTKMGKITQEFVQGFSDWISLDHEVPHEDQFKQWRGLLKRMTAEVDALESMEQQKIQTHTAEVLQYVVLILASGLALGVAVGLFLSFHISSRLRALSHRASEIAEGTGDLSKTFTESGRDEVALLAQDLNRFLGKTRELVALIQSAANRVRETAALLREHSQKTQNACDVLRRNSALEQLCLDKSHASIAEWQDGFRKLARLVSSPSPTIDAPSPGLTSLNSRLLGLLTESQDLAVGVWSEEGRQKPEEWPLKLQSVVLQWEDLLDQYQTWDHSWTQQLSELNTGISKQLELMGKASEQMGALVGTVDSSSQSASEVAQTTRILGHEIQVLDQLTDELHSQVGLFRLPLDERSDDKKTSDETHRDEDTEDREPRAA